MTQAQRDRKAYENSRLGQMHRDEQKQIDASKDADRQRGVNMLVSKE